MIRLVMIGAAGKMGSAILRLASADPSVKVTGGVESKDRISSCPSGLPVFDSLLPALKDGDVVIDFTSPSVSILNLEAAKAAKKAIVIGTTGLVPDQIEKIKAASKVIPIVFSPNMSAGVNVLFSLLSTAARSLPDYDIEIVEMHHNQKKDAPSGTAMKLAEVAAGSSGRDLKKSAVYGREGTSCLRKKEDIGIMSLRGGDVVGDHTVFITGMGERLELTHRAQSRDVLAAGALRAAKWLADKPAGLYDMSDVLGLKK